VLFLVAGMLNDFRLYYNSALFQPVALPGGVKVWAEYLNTHRTSLLLWAKNK